MSLNPNSSFQTTVNINEALAVPGEVFFDGPIRSKPANVYSAGVPNVVGYAYTVSTAANPNPAGAASNAQTVQVGGTGFFAGILVNPKAYAAVGTTAQGPLGPTLAIPDYYEGELLSMGEVAVYLPGPANPGDLVTYNTSTGALNSIPPTVSFTASIAAGGSAGVNDVMTVSAITQGTLAVGQLVTGSNTAGGTYISSLGTGKGGTGTYNLSSINEQTVSSAVLTASPNVAAPAFAASSAYITTGTLTITTLTSGELTVGQVITGTGIAPNTIISAYGTGVGGTGNYTVTPSQTVGSSGTPIAISGGANLTIPHCEVGIFGNPTAGGVCSIKLTN